MVKRSKEETKSPARTGTRLTNVEQEDRLLDCEQHLIRLRSSRRVESAMAKKYGVSRRTARRWLQRVRERWAEDANGEGEEIRAERRTNYRATLNEVIAVAMNRTRSVRDGDGFVKVADPDLRAALSAVEQLRRLDGVDAAEAPRVFDARVSGNVGLTDIFASLASETAKDS